MAYSIPAAQTPWTVRAYVLTQNTQRWQQNSFTKNLLSLSSIEKLKAASLPAFMAIGTVFSLKKVLISQLLISYGVNSSLLLFGASALFALLSLYLSIKIFKYLVKRLAISQKPEWFQRAEHIQRNTQRALAQLSAYENFLKKGLKRLQDACQLSPFAPRETPGALRKKIHEVESFRAQIEESYADRLRQVNNARVSPETFPLATPSSRSRRELSLRRQEEIQQMFTEEHRKARKEACLSAIQDFTEEGIELARAMQNAPSPIQSQQVQRVVQSYGSAVLEFAQAYPEMTPNERTNNQQMLNTLLQLCIQAERTFLIGTRSRPAQH